MCHQKMSEGSENVEISQKRSKKHHDPPDEESSQSEDGKPNHLDGDVIFRALGDSRYVKDPVRLSLEWQPLKKVCRI